MELRLSLDFERLPEFWRLTHALRVRAHDPLTVEATAVWLVVRLFVALGYQARSTNQPGVLTPAGAEQFRATLGTCFGEDCDPVGLLTDAGLLLADAAGWQCPLFAHHNAHLAGNYRAPHIKGNIRSRLSAAKNHIAQAAIHQAMLLPPEVFCGREGQALDQRTVEQATVMIMTLDRCLKVRPRHHGEFTQGVIADAAAALGLGLLREDLEGFYYWVAENREHPALPKTCEEILARFGDWYRASKQGDL